MLALELIRAIELSKMVEIGEKMQTPYPCNLLIAYGPRLLSTLTLGARLASVPLRVITKHFAMTINI
jgi:hypothetical protein